MKQITLEDIARACGVSKAAVSYVLNGRSGAFSVSEATTRLILDECTRVGYRPDAAAQALARLKNAPLNLLFLSPWLYSQMSDFSTRVHAELQRAENVHVTFVPYERGSLKLTASQLKRCDAVIIAGTASEDDRYLSRHRQDFSKVVLLNRNLEGFPCAYGDDEAACNRLGLMLRGKYERFAAIRGNGRVSELKAARLRGFCAATGAQELAEPDDVPGTCYFFTQYYDAALYMRDRRDVPDKIGVAAYDQHATLCHFVRPSLTTVDPGLEEMTRNAVAAAKIIKNGGAPGSVMTNGVIIPGESTLP